MKLRGLHIEILHASACSRLVKFPRGWGWTRSGPFYADISVGALVRAKLLTEKGHPLGRIAVLSAIGAQAIAPQPLLGGAS